MKATTFQALISKSKRLPIGGGKKSIEAEVPSHLYPEENLLGIFGWQRGGKSAIAIYKVVEGVFTHPGFYHLSAGPSKVRSRDHAAPLNWARGISTRIMAGELPSGGYGLRTLPEVKHSGELALPVDTKTCLGWARGLTPVAEVSPTRLWVLDEVGASGANHNVTLSSQQAQACANGRFLGNLWASNPGLVSLWRDTLSQATVLSTALGSEAASRITALQDTLLEAVMEHVGSLEQEAQKAPWINEMGRKLVRLVGGIHTLANEGDISLAQLNGINEGEVPLIVAMSGTPVVVGEAELPDSFRFPMSATVGQDVFAV